MQNRTFDTDDPQSNLLRISKKRRAIFGEKSLVSTLSVV